MGLEQELQELQDHCRKAGATEYHLFLLDCPILTTDEKLKIAVAKKAFESSSPIEAIIAEWNKQTARGIGL